MVASMLFGLLVHHSKLVGDDLTVDFSDLLELIAFTIDHVDAHDGIDTEHQVALASKYKVADVVNCTVYQSFLFATQLDIEVIRVQGTLLWTVALSLTVCFVRHKRGTNVDFELEGALDYTDAEIVPSNS